METDFKVFLIDALKNIAPETEPGLLKPEDPIREKLGMDSFDFLQFIIVVSEHLGINIPEADYGKVTTLKDLESYLKKYKSAESKKA